MALFKILKGSSANLSSQKIREGYCYVTTDEGKMYIDVSDTKRICLNAGDSPHADKADAADKLTYKRLINGVEFDGSSDIYFYGTCSTAAGTAAKTVTLQSGSTFLLKTGATVIVKFTNKNSASSPTLNINGTGAKPIYRYGTTAASTSDGTSGWRAGSVHMFTYDGTGWIRHFWENTNTIPSGYCTTAADTAAKTASCTDYALKTNSYLQLIIKTANTSKTALTLNVNGKGAKPIYINGAASSTSNYTLPAGSYITFYNGTNYYIRTDGKLPGSIESATTANSLGSMTVGNAQRPTYFNGGVPTQTTYRMAGTNAAATTAVSIENDLDTGIWYVNGTNGIYNQSDGVVIANKYSDKWITEIYQDYRTGQLAVRGKNNGTWQGWRKILDSTNYTSYTVKKDGTGASGTWGINISGNAASASKLSAQRTITLTGDVTGSGSSDGSTGWSITATVKDDSHNHVISNVDGLQDALNSKISQGASSLEINSTGSLKDYGGFIDFHYHDENGKPTDASGAVVKKTPDYTSRIIEDAPGVIKVNGVAFQGGNITGTLKGTADKANNLGNYTVGGTSQPVYFNGGVPTAITAVGAAYGGTGKTSLVDSANALLNALSAGSSTPSDNDYFISQYVNGGTTTTTYHRRPISKIYDYIKGKASGTWNINISGNAATATHATTAGSAGTAGKADTADVATKARLTEVILNDTSNWKLGLQWRNTTLESGTYLAGIGRHNSGGPSTNPGSITIIPYATNTEPWGGSVGLFISKDALKFENNTVLHSGNYTSYTVKKDGTGATGTWKINITGNANYATSAGTAGTAGVANSVAWNNVTNKPSSYPPSSHTHDYIMYKDTRNDNQSPDDLQTGLTIHLKNNSTDGLTDGGTYHAVIGIKDWGDYSGGPYGQIATTKNENLWFRTSTSGTTWGNWKKIIHSDNIGSQSVNYATSAGTAGTAGNATNANHAITADSATKATQDGDGNTISSTYAKVKTWNNFVHNSNEFTFAAPAYGGTDGAYLWLNYRTASGKTDGNITGYKFGNGKGAITGVTVEAATFKGALDGNAKTATYATSAGTAGTANSATSATTATTATRISLNGIDDSTTYGTYGGIIQDSSTGPEEGSWHNSIKILHSNANKGWYTQLAQNFTGTEGLWHRSYRNGVQGSWHRVLDSNCYTSYTVKKDGTGATGTWKINITGNANYATSAGSAGSATSAEYLKTSITFTPAETALTQDNVYKLIGQHGRIKRGTWNYSGNGYIAKGNTTASQCPYGAIDLAGTTVIQAANNSTQYTQIYITPPTASTTNAIKGEMLYYINNGSGYSPTWYRVLTDKNYNSYTVKKDGTGASGTWGISISGNAATATNATNANHATTAGSAGSATTASKLTTDAGGTTTPVYFSGGVPKACTMIKSGAWYGGLTYVGGDGVMEVGKYIDFHVNKTGTGDYDVRITAATTGLTISGTTSGAFKGSLDGNAKTATHATTAGSASSATYLTNLDSNDTASSTATWRRLWFCYNDNTTGRPAYDDRFAIQTSTGTLKAPIFSGNLSGNASSATLLKAGATLTSETADSALESTASLKINTANNTVYNTNDGLILTASWSASYGAQIWLDDGGGEGGMAIRNRNANGWNPWRQVITSANIGSQSVSHATTAGTAGSATSATTATTATQLSSNTRMDYGWNGLNYFNISGTAGNAAKTNDTPTSAWWHILRFNHANSNGYYTDLAVPFNANSLYYKRIANGAVQNSGWVKVLDALNFNSYALPLSGGTVTGTLILSKTTDTAADADNGPALIVGGTRTTSHIEIDCNEVIAKSNGTTETDLYLGTNSAKVHIGQSNIGGSTRPIYLKAGVPTACSGRTVPGIKSASAVGTLGWGTNNTYVADISLLAYWNGAYSNTSSNLAYCDRGRFGSIITHDASDYLRYYDSNSEMTTTETVNAPTYLHTVSTTGGTITTATKPSGMDNAWGVLHVHTHSGNYATQLGFGGTTGNLYMRNAYNSATFGSWRTILDSGNWTGIVDGRYVKKTGDSMSGTLRITPAYQGTASARYHSASLEIREAGGVGSAQSNIGYAPRIGFHWGNRAAASLCMNASGHFEFRGQDDASYRNITAQEFYSNGWFRNYGERGLYNETYGCHVMPFTGSYGGVRITGNSRGSYDGLIIGDAAGITLMSSTDRAHHGLYHQEKEQWAFYYNKNNKYASVLGANVSATGFPFTVYGATYIDGRLVVKGNGNSYNEGIRILPASNGWSNIFFSANTTTEGTMDGGWLIGRRGSAGGTYGAAGDFCIENNNSAGVNLTLTKSGILCNIGPIFGYRYKQTNNGAAFMWDKPGSHYTGMGANGSSNTIQFGPCDASGNWVSNFHQHWRFIGSMSADSVISTPVVTGGMWITGSHEGAFRVTSATNASAGGYYQAWFSGKTPNGAWGMGPLAGSNDLYFVYGTDANYNAGTNDTRSVRFSSDGKVWGAVWNDYAEFRTCVTTFEAGQVVCENGDDTLSLSTERLQPGACIVSDTFGFAIGETNIADCPIAVSGRVLAYPYEDRNSYKAGDPVCAGPNGTVSKMTREEVREYPDRMIGTVSAIPKYETWGQENIPVNGRIWIKVV